MIDEGLEVKRVVCEMSVQTCVDECLDLHRLIRHDQLYLRLFFLRLILLAEQLQLNGIVCDTDAAPSSGATEVVVAP